MGGLLVLRPLAKLNSIPLANNPAFWLACFGWVLGFKVARFWEDWGWPALMVLMTWDLQLFLQIALAENSFKRLGLTLGLAAATFLCVTNDADSRWSQTSFDRYLTPTIPTSKAGCLTRAEFFIRRTMTLFYQTFFKNPTGDWRYMLGFEPTWMPAEDFKSIKKCCGILAK